MRVKPAKLVGYQKKILYGKKRFTVTEAGTKIGKTFSHLWWLFEIAHGKNKDWYYDSVKPGMNFWWVAPVYKQSEIAFNRMRAKVRGVKGYSVNLSKRTITTPLGTIITFLTADNPDNLYGEDVYGVVFDEFTRSKRAAWVALRSTLTATKAPCKLIGNFIGDYNWGHLMAVRDKTGEFEYHVVTAHDAVRAGILDLEEVESAKATLTENEFNKLYLCKGGGDDCLVSVAKVLKLWTNTHVPDSDEMYMVVDVAGQGKDKMVIAAFEGMTMIGYKVISKSNGLQIVSGMKVMQRSYDIPNSNICFDAVGVGEAATGYFDGAFEFKSNMKPFRQRETKDKDDNIILISDYDNLRDDCAHYLADVINDEEMYIHCVMDEETQEEIQQELGELKSDITKKKDVKKIISKDEIKQNINRSPNWQDVLIMRMVFEIKPVKEFTWTI